MVNNIVIMSVKSVLCRNVDYDNVEKNNVDNVLYYTDWKVAIMTKRIIL
jgi:hypothetical protein